VKLLSGLTVVKFQNDGVSLVAVNTRVLGEIDKQLQMHRFPASDGICHSSLFVLFRVFLIVSRAICPVAGFAEGMASCFRLVLEAELGFEFIFRAEFGILSL